MFADGSPFRTAVLPIGGNNVTNDVALGLKTSLQVAEELKIEHGTCNLATVGEDEEISVSASSARTPAGRSSGARCARSSRPGCARRSSSMRAEMARGGGGMLPAGIILTGGGAQLAGTAELAREVLGMPVRIAAPAGIGGLVDTILNPGLLDGGRAAPVGRRRRSPTTSRCATSRRRRAAAWAGSATRSGASFLRRMASRSSLGCGGRVSAHRESPIEDHEAQSGPGRSAASPT